MVKVIAGKALDMTALNFAHVLKSDKAHVTKTVIRIDNIDEAWRDRFNGKFSANYFSQTLTGTAKSWVRTNYWTGNPIFEISGLSLSAAAVIKAAKSKTLTDDRSIIQSAFSGNDNINGSDENDVLHGYAGNDTFHGGLGLDAIDGGSGTQDRLSYDDRNEAVVVALDKGNWTGVTIGGLAEDTVRNIEDVVGGSQGDTLTGDGNANMISGGAGGDTIDGGAGNDTLLGGADADSIMGGEGTDSILGGSGGDTIYGGNGADKISGDDDGDWIDGGSGKDTVDGGTGADSIFGGTDADKLLGGADNDTIDGGSGGDSLDGGTGQDVLIGGAGRDTMTGGSDADIFRFLSASESGTSATTRDYITDFKQSQFDQIDLSAIDAITSVGTDEDEFQLDAKGKSNTAVLEGHIGWYTVNKSGTANDRTYIRINNDADVAVDVVIELKGVVNLGLTDFIV